jgi:hypothetical protein
MHWTEQYPLARQLDADHWLVVAPLTFGRARVIVATEEACGEHW